MDRRSFLNTFAAICAGVLATTLRPAEAQRERRGGRADRPRVQALIRQLENDTDQLRRRADEVIRRDRANERRGRQLRDRVRELELSTDRLRAGVDRSRVFESRVTRREADALIRAGERVQDIIQDEERWRDRLGSAWDRTRRDLNELARIYDLRTLADR